MAISPTQNVEADDPPVPLDFHPEHVYAPEMLEKTFLNIKFDRVEFVVHDMRFQNYTVKRHSDTIQHKKYIFTITNLTYSVPFERYKSR